MPDEPDFQVVDNRRPHTEDADESPADDARPGTVDPSVDVDDLPPFTAEGVIHTCIRLLSEGAWSWLGLMPDPMTGKTEKDLKQARMGIDALRALTQILEPTLEPSARRELQNVVANLQVNFVQKSVSDSKGNGEQ